MDLSNVKVDFNAVERVFVDAVIEQAEQKGVHPDKLALVLFPEPSKKDFRTRVRIMSLDGSFEDEIVRLRKVTMYDLTGHISQAIMKIFEHEVIEHNEALSKGIVVESVKNLAREIDLHGLECYIQVKSQGGSMILNMAFTHENEFVRPYNIKNEFQDVV